MGPDEDDFEDREPLPDPTMREWRHPSELAALANMAARDAAGPAPRHRLAFGSLLLGGALGAVAVLSIVASTGLLGGRSPDARFDLRDPTTVAPTAGSAGGDGAPDGGAEPAPDGGGGTATGPTAAPTTTVVSTTTAPTTTEAPTTTTTSSPATLAPLDDELAVASLPAVPAGAVVGVAVGDHEVGEPRCTGLVIDGMVVTSASAIGTATEVVLVVDGAAHRATVVGRDRFTDVALLEPHGDARLQELAPAAPPAPDAPVALVATDGQPEPITVAGRITAHDQVAAASDGHDLIGLVATTARLPESGAGAPLLDPAGALVGMVVDTSGHVALAVPEATLRIVARSLRDTGHAVPVWVGVSVVDDHGAVVVEEVVPGGPAATAGLRRGDVITSLGGTDLADMAAFFAGVRAHQPGDVVAVGFERAGEPLAVDVVVASPPVPQPGPDEQAAD